MWYEFSPRSKTLCLSGIKNVEQCRRPSMSNGPTHIEIKAGSFGPLPQFHRDVTRTEVSLNLTFARNAVEDARKEHTNCPSWGCEIETFGNGSLFDLK